MAGHEKKRCGWAGADPLLVRYHDEEWGQPIHDDRRLFELLTLEGAQAGLSWLTVLRKREGYRKAFRGFDPAAVARFGPREVKALLADPGIVRNRAKIESTIENARRVVELQREGGSLDRLVWSSVDGKTVRARRRSQRDVPSSSPAAAALSKTLRARGLRFVGPTICYAFMEACGLVDDHVQGCFRARR